MEEHREISFTPGSPQESPENTTLQLRERISELEAENANLRQLDETVRRNARLVQALLDKSQEGILLLTPQMTFLRMIHSVLGNTNQSVAGQSALVSIHPEDHGIFCEAFSRLLSNPSQAITFECRGWNTDGHWRWLEIEMTDMLDDPDVQAIVLNARDITHRKKSDEASRDQERQRACQGCLCGRHQP
jgi:PAS domain S-box-containing protein